MLMPNTQTLRHPRLTVIMEDIADVPEIAHVSYKPMRTQSKFARRDQPKDYTELAGVSFKLLSAAEIVRMSQVLVPVTEKSRLTFW